VLLVFGFIAAVLVVSTGSPAQTGSFHNAPASAAAEKDTYLGSANVQAGQKLFAQNCAACHGPAAQGMGNIPGLAKGPTQTAKPGEIFWYVTHGDKANGMPAWDSIGEHERWQLVTYLRALPKLVNAPPAGGGSEVAAVGAITGPAPKAPFTDFRFESPGTIRKIRPENLPAPFATASAGNGPKVVARPENAWPKVPNGFKVDLYATGLDNPRLIRSAPNGDFFVAEFQTGQILVFRGFTAQGKPEIMSVFATGLPHPFGINFYPAGPNPQWVYVGNTNSVVRFPYQNGDLKARGAAEHLADLAGEPHGHVTRDIQFSPDGHTMFVSVGSGSNVDDPDTHPDERLRADILAFNPDGTNMRVYASGIRNPVGLAVNPTTGELWCSVNERDALGDNLVPDYITHVEPGGFYGWPWYYMGSNQDPRHEGKHPELKGKVLVPDVLLQPHNASLEMMFYQGKQFPQEYQGDIFAAEHGSWNRGIRAGYELIRVPLHQTGHATGEYEDFLTGFVLPDGNVWGRPVGVTAAPDGSLLVTDDGSDSIWRITYTGK
jgi:glucose/arabinose dehydrogenase/mono/diheme cytochrome c family protein